MAAEAGDSNTRRILAGSSRRRRHVLAGNLNSRETMAGNLKCRETMAGNSNAGEALAGNLNATETMAGSLNASEVLAGNANSCHSLAGSLNATNTPVRLSTTCRRLLAGDSNQRHTSARNPSSRRHLLAGNSNTSHSLAGNSNRRTRLAGNSNSNSNFPPLAVLTAMAAFLLTCAIPAAATTAAVPSAAVTAVNSRHSFLRDSASELELGFDVPPPIRIVTVEGSRLLIPCRPIGDERRSANVTWTNEGRVVNDPHRHVLANGTLLITEVKVRDVGQYRCILRKGTLAVLSAPSSLVLADTGSWQMLPRNTTIRQNSAVRLTCHLPSIPPATFTWLVDDQPLGMGGARFYQPTPGVLQITEVREEDAGVYRCQAVNPMIGQNLTSPGGYLSVLATPNPIPGESSVPPEDAPPPRPTLLAVPSKVEAQVGHRAVLECITDDVSAPRLVWSRIDGREIRKAGVTTGGQGSLVFSEVVEQDAGVYNCSVISPLLHDPVTQMIELSVLEPPSVDVYPRMRLVRNGGSIVRLNCTATGIPLPEISWHKDGNPIPRTGRHTFMTQMLLPTTTRKQLAISNIMANDSGIYQCIVKNRVGVSSEGALLIVDLPPDMPGAPLNLRVTKTTASSIEVQWDPPMLSSRGAEGGRERESQGYVLHYFQMNGQGQERQCVTNNTNYEIFKLNPFTRYWIYVRTFVIYQGQQNHLIGEPSSTLVVRTRANRPLSIPEVHLQPLSPSTLRVTWTLLTEKEARGPIVQQKIQWKYREHFYDMAELGPLDEEYEIRDLRPNKRYEIRVLEATESGYPEHEAKLPWTQIRMPNDADQLAKPIVHLTLSDASPDAIHIDWTLPEHLKSKLLCYELTYNSTLKNSKVRNLKPEITSVVLERLKRSTNYTIHLEAVYKDGRQGAGVTHAIQTFPTPSTIPIAHGRGNKLGVKALKVRTLNSTCVAMTWKPIVRRVVPDFYTVVMVNLGRTVGGEGGEEEEDGGGDGGGGGDMASLRSRQDIGLPPNIQDGPRSAEEEEEEKEEEKEEEPRTRFSDEPPKDLLRHIRSTRRKITQCGLEPCSTYEITVTASTTSATSVPSEAVVVTTKEGVPTAPMNTSWTAMSPKDVALNWSPPKDINGVLLYYLVTYSHDHQEWRNQTVSPRVTNTEIRGLISNTNYTLSIAGVTGGGVGTQTTVYIYIRAILFTGEEARMSPKSVAVVIAVAALAVFTCLGVLIVCMVWARHRRSAGIKSLQGNGNCRYITANGVTAAAATTASAASTDHGSEMNVYQPMLTSLPTAHPRHLDTKGGPGIHEDGAVPNCTHDANIFHGSQMDVPNATLFPSPRDVHDGAVGGISCHVDDSLDDIDEDEVDATSTLLQNTPSTPTHVLRPEAGGAQHSRPDLKELPGEGAGEAREAEGVSDVKEAEGVTDDVASKFSNACAVTSSSTP